MALQGSVAAMLAGYTPGDTLQVTQLDRARQLLASAPGSLFRAHFLPGHFTASAVVLHPREPAVALVLHGKLGRWLQPGGHLEETDTDVIAAAAREVREETGLAELALARPGLFDLDVHTIPSFRDEPMHEHFDLRFVFRAGDDRLAPAEVRDCRWVPLAHTRELVTDVSLRRMLAALGRGAA
jgi:8-oxo-dGTP pyrophosphatase MutT (NUDIX family)